MQGNVQFVEDHQIVGFPRESFPAVVPTFLRSHTVFFFGRPVQKAAPAELFGVDPGKERFDPGLVVAHALDELSHEYPLAGQRRTQGQAEGCRGLAFPVAGIDTPSPKECRNNCFLFMTSR